ncbi:hypothetical protein [Paracoccus sp. FO-3]|uniref:hypothetical protein n=1 Tax=Paracoccus sp. FO-3 TaxID=1335059 RepID=UPI00112DFF76|nr:hypothetical protein [Paracoccus sp. FO-3]
MADYYTSFSCLLDTGTPEKASHALDLFARLRVEDEATDEWQASGFAVELQDWPTKSMLWIHDDDHGDVENLVAFVLRCAEELDLSGLWGFTYADICCRPRIDGFGGGAHVVDLGARKSIGWISASEWLSAALNGEDIDAVEALAQ